MKRLFETHGKLVISILTVTAAISLLLAGAYIGTSGLTSHGIMAALGEEADIRDEDTADNRSGPELDGLSEAPASTALHCSGVVMEAGVPIAVTDLFMASLDDGTALPVRILHVVDGSGRECLNRTGVALEHGSLTIETPGQYRCTVRATADRSVTRVFDIYVGPKAEEVEV